MSNQLTPAGVGPLEGYISRYPTTRLTDDQATLWLPLLRELVRATSPADEHEARSAFYALIRFLTDRCDDRVTVSGVWLST